MNRQPIISRRGQQEFITSQKTVTLYYAVRACPCDGVGCQTCDGKMKYYDVPIPVRVAIVNGMNTKKKDPLFPMMKEGSYKLVYEPRLHIADGDRVSPIGIREFEDAIEIITVEDSKLTFSPSNPRGVTISFAQEGGGVIDFLYGKDFTIEKEQHGPIKIWGKQIKWITNPSGENFSVRYNYVPTFEIDGIPPARIAEGQKLLPEAVLKKLTIGGESKSPSYEQSSDAARGVRAGLQYE